MADERTNEELAKEVAQRAYEYEHDGLPLAAATLDEAARRLRAMEGKRIDGWVSSELLRGSKDGPWREFTFNTLLIWAEDMPAILILPHAPGAER